MSDVDADALAAFVCDALRRVGGITADELLDAARKLPVSTLRRVTAYQAERDGLSGHARDQFGRIHPPGSVQPDRFAAEPIVIEHIAGEGRSNVIEMRPDLRTG